jgi:predicted nuclease of predicted toxin-antitoxin system
MHKLLLDQNLSYKIIKNIEHIFPKSTHVRLLNLDTSDDLTVWRYAKENGYHIVTQDTDFSDINTLNGYPPKNIRINTGNTATQTIIKLLQNKSEIINEFLDNEKIGYLEID